MAITWKNINSDLADTALAAARITENANAGIAQGIRGLAGNLEDYRTDKTDKNTSAYLDQLAGYGSAEELDAARQSGVLANMRSGFGDFIDPNALRGAADTRRNELFAEGTATRNRANADYTYGQNELTKNFRVLEDKFNAFNVSDDDVGRDALMNSQEFRDHASGLGRFAEFEAAKKTQDESERLAARTKKTEAYTDSERNRLIAQQAYDDGKTGDLRAVEGLVQEINGFNANQQYPERDAYMANPENRIALEQANLWANMKKGFRTEDSARAIQAKSDYKERERLQIEATAPNNSFYNDRGKSNDQKVADVFKEIFPSGDKPSRDQVSAITEIIEGGIQATNKDGDEDNYTVTSNMLINILRAGASPFLGSDSTYIKDQVRKYIASSGYDSEVKGYQQIESIEAARIDAESQLLNTTSAYTPNASVEPLNQAGAPQTPQDVSPSAETKEPQPDFPPPTKKETSKVAKNIKRLAELESELEASGNTTSVMGITAPYDSVISGKIRKQKLLIKENKKRDEQRERKNAIKSGQYFGR